MYGKAASRAIRPESPRSLDDRENFETMKNLRVNAVHAVRTARGRWILTLPSALPTARDWVWTGSGWVRHEEGFDPEIEIDFESEERALAYAREHVVEARRA